MTILRSFPIKCQSLHAEFKFFAKIFAFVTTQLYNSVSEVFIGKTQYNVELRLGLYAR